MQKSCNASGERAFELDREQLGQRTVNVHTAHATVVKAPDHSAVRRIVYELVQMRPLASSGSDTAVASFISFFKEVVYNEMQIWGIYHIELVTLTIRLRITFQNRNGEQRLSRVLCICA